MANYTEVATVSEYQTPLIDSSSEIINDATQIIDEYVLSVYGPSDKPAFVNYLLTQNDDFLTFQDGILMNISGTVYESSSAINQPIYTSV